MILGRLQEASVCLEVLRTAWTGDRSQGTLGVGLCSCSQGLSTALDTLQSPHYTPLRSLCLSSIHDVHSWGQGWEQEASATLWGLQLGSLIE